MLYKPICERVKGPSTFENHACMAWINLTKLQLCKYMQGMYSSMIDYTPYSGNFIAIFIYCYTLSKDYSIVTACNCFTSFST